MTIYLLLIAVILIGSWIGFGKKNQNSFYIKIVFLSLLFIVGLRHISLGIFDTEFVYVPKFKEFQQMSISEIYMNQSKDVTFYIFAKIVGLINENVHFIVFILAIPYLYAVCWLVKNYSVNPRFSFVLFLGMQYFTISYFLLRQVVAMAIIIFSYKFLEERKFTKFLLMIGVATLFHQTALIFIIAYPLVRMKPGIIQWIGVIGSFLISIFMRTTFMSKVVNILNMIFAEDNRFSNYANRESSLSYTGFYIQLLVFICISLWYVSKKQKKIFFSIKNFKIKIRHVRKSQSTYKEVNDTRMDYMYNLSAISLMWTSLVVILGEFNRIACYFGIFNIVLLSNALDYITNKRNKKLIECGMVVVFLLYFVFFNLENINALPYRFFWQ